MNPMLFCAANNDTANIAVSSASQRVQVCNSMGRIQVRVMNNGTATAWIAFGDVTVTTAATTGVPIAPGSTCGFSVDPPLNGPLYAAAIAAASTGSIYFTPGTGI